MGRSLTVTIRGTGLPATLPDEFVSFFRDGVACSRRHGMPHENEAASLYFALRAMELRGLDDTRELRGELVRALLRRREACGGFWTHEHRDYRKGGSGLRSTAGAIRVLADAAGDGLLDDPSVVTDSLRIHLGASEVLDGGGRWFLHDTSETPDFPLPPPRGLRANRAWGSGERNSLILNTHLDTVTTLAFVARSVELADADRTGFETALGEGLRALEAVLAPGRGIGRAAFHAIDRRVRSAVLRRGGQVTGLRRRYFKRIRPRLKARHPGFRFEDGYLERDIGFEGSSFRYHVLNLLDLTRLSCSLDLSGTAPDHAERCRAVALPALEYAFESAYREHVAAAIRNGKGWPIGLCESLLAHFRSGLLLDERWFLRYAEIRREVPPSAAVLGYEPSYLAPESEEARAKIAALDLDPARADAHPLPDGRILVIEPASEPPFRYA